MVAFLVKLAWQLYLDINHINHIVQIQYFKFKRKEKINEKDRKREREKRYKKLKLFMYFLVFYWLFSVFLRLFLFLVYGRAHVHCVHLYIHSSTLAYTTRSLYESLPQCLFALWCDCCLFLYS